MILLMEDIRLITWDVLNPKNNGMNYQPQLVQVFFSINSTISARPSFVTQLSLTSLHPFFPYHPHFSPLTKQKRSTRVSPFPSTVVSICINIIPSLPHNLLRFDVLGKPPVIPPHVEGAWKPRVLDISPCDNPF